MCTGLMILPELYNPAEFGKTSSGYACFILSGRG